MATTTEKEITTELGNATPDQVLAGTTYSSDSGIMLTGELDLGEAVTAGTVKYDNSGSTLTGEYVQNAIDELDTKVENKSEKGHTHDDRYYTETEVNAKVTALQNSISWNTNNIAALQTAVKTNTTDIATNKTNISTNATAITALQNDVSDLLSAEDITETTETTMPNSHKGRLMFEEIGGVSEQASTTGAQLLDFEPYVNFTANADYKASDAINKNPFSKGGGTYAISCTGTIGTNYRFWAYDAENNVIVDAYFTDKIINVTDEIANSVVSCRVVVLGLVSGTSYSGYVYPMINYGTTAFPWEPYTGGQASPNPSYPQEIYSVKGKNLLDCRGLTEQTVNGVTFTPAYDDNGNLLYVEANGTATANAYYRLITASSLNKQSVILNGCPSGGSTSTYSLRIFNSNDASVYSEDIGSGISCDGYDTYSCEALVRSGYTATNLRFYPMIRPASVSDATYVPYGLLRVKTHGNNLLDMRKARNGLINGVTVTMNDDGSYLFVGTATNNAINVWLLGNWGTTEPVLTLPAGTYYVQGVCLHNNTSVLAQCTKDTGVIVRFSKDTDITGIRVVQATSGNTYNDTIYPIIAKSDVSVPWEPYTESSITLSKPIELCGIGDVQDVIDVENGVVRKRFFEYVFTGEENCIASITNGGIYCQATIDGIPIDKSTAKILCNKLIQRGTEELWNNNISGFSLGINDNAYNFRFRFPEINDVVDLDSLKAQLSEWYNADNPLTIVSELSTGEEVIDLPTADRIALNSLLTYDGATYLEWDCYLEPTFKGEYGTSKVGGVALRACAEGCIAGIVTDDIIELGTDIEV